MLFCHGFKNDIATFAFITYKCSVYEMENKSSAVAETGDRLATIDMGRKVGAAVCPFPWGSWASI